MKPNKKLLELTNKFLKEFLDVCAEEDKKADRTKRDDLYHFNFTLAEAIGQSNYPRYEEQHTLLMGMASFDDSIAKAFFNNRCQGFVAAIEERIAYTAEQEDYLVKNVKCEEYLTDDFKLEFFKTESGENSFNTIPCKTKAQKITFDVSNNRSGFEGNAIIYKSGTKNLSTKKTLLKSLLQKKLISFAKKTK